MPLVVPVYLTFKGIINYFKVASATNREDMNKVMRSYHLKFFASTHVDIINNVSIYIFIKKVKLY
jgi:hypothetical protein